MPQDEIFGFGLAHLKGEGAPIHPDDMGCVLTDEQYNKQLEAYNKYWDK